jgi:hypothetical protein
MRTCLMLALCLTAIPVHAVGISGSTTIDASALTSDRFQVDGVTYSGSAAQTISLAPGVHTFYQVGLHSNGFQFTTDAAGNVSFSSAYNGFLSASGTSLTVRGYTVAVDSRALTTQSVYIELDGETWVPRGVTSVTTVPGYIRFHQRDVFGNSVDLRINDAGGFALTPSQLAWAHVDTPAVAVLDGFDFEVDASALTTLNVYVETDGQTWRPSDTVIPLRGIPGTYRVHQQDVWGNAFDFTVLANGTISRTPIVEGFTHVAGRRVIVDGYTFQLRAPGLTAVDYYVEMSGQNWTPRDQTSEFVAIPGNYRFHQHDPWGNAFDFALTSDGELSLNPVHDSFAHIEGDTMVVDGIAFEVEAPGLTSIDYYVEIAGQNWTPRDQTSLIVGIPGWYRFHQHDPWGNSFDFRLEPNESLTLQADHDFVHLEDDLHLVVDGYPFEVTAAELTSNQFFVEIAGQNWMHRSSPLDVVGIPGNYRFHQNDPWGTSFDFRLTNAGALAFSAQTQAGFAEINPAGDALTVHGYEFLADFSGLYPFGGLVQLSGQTWADQGGGNCDRYQVIRSIPGFIRLYERDTYANSVDVTLAPDGEFQIPPALGSAVTWDTGSRALAARGTTITVDGAALAGDRWNWEGQGWTPDGGTVCANILPGNHRVYAASGAAIDFGVSGAGVITPIGGAPTVAIAGGSCPPPPPACDDDNACTDGTCDPWRGCDYEDNTDACDDADACSGDDICWQGTCQGGFEQTCDTTCDVDGDGRWGAQCLCDADPSLPGCLDVVEDCDDTQAAIYDGAFDACYDGVDAACDGDDREWDCDGDTYADPSAPGPWRAAHGSPASDDCDDGADAVYPGAFDEPYDGIDADCAGDADCDVDGDGWIPAWTAGFCAGQPGDCDDADPTSYPGAEEIHYDNIDQNCGYADDFDADGDGHVSAAHAADYKGDLPTDDCDDTRKNVYPGAPDDPYDGLDADCAGDDDCDQDGDDLYPTGYPACEPEPGAAEDCDDRDASVPGFDACYDGRDADCGRDDDFDCDGDGHVSADFARDYDGPLPADDCDDGRADVFPGAADDQYDGLDADCAGDDDFDADGDGHADAAWAATYSGALPVDDCDDGAWDVHPGALDAPYDGIDSDCAGDDDYDLDGDGHVSSTWSSDYAGPLPADDCDDGVMAVHPGAADRCYDATDSDCDGWDDYDCDRDGHVAGFLPDDWPTTLPIDDCDDGDASIHPDAIDACYDRIDADCARDDDFDCDRDAHADAAHAFDYDGSLPADDCDDATPATHPGAFDARFDGVDADCDPLGEYDADGDGWVTDAWAEAAGLPGGDCDDADATIHPGAVDAPYDGIDADCAGDDDCDADADGGVPSGLSGPCAGGGGDCDDRDPTVSPESADACHDGVDANCDGLDDDDCDRDGHISTDLAGDYAGSLPVDDCDDARGDVYPGAADAFYDGIDADCAGDDDFDADVDGHADLGHAASYTGDLPADDCDDARDDVRPGAPDPAYDGLDADCGGGDDFDADGDGHADLGHAATYAGDLPADDCDDARADVFPGASDASYDGLDADCAGDDDFDADEDGFAQGADCDDGDPGVHPGATDAADDGVDQDCDGADAVDPTTDVEPTDEEPVTDDIIVTDELPIEAEDYFYSGGCGGCDGGGGAGGWLGLLLAAGVARRRR